MIDWRVVGGTTGSGNCNGGNGSSGGGTPGGSDTQVQFNNHGTFGGNTLLRFDDPTSTLFLPDGSSWGPNGITSPAGSLTGLTGSFGGGNDVGFYNPANNGAFIMQAGSAFIPLDV